MLLPRSKDTLRIIRPNELERRTAFAPVGTSTPSCSGASAAGGAAAAGAAAVLAVDGEPTLAPPHSQLAALARGLLCAARGLGDVAAAAATAAAGAAAATATRRRG